MLCYVWLGMVWFSYISFSYFITPKIGKCHISKEHLGTAAVPVSCAIIREKLCFILIKVMLYRFTVQYYYICVFNALFFIKVASFPTIKVGISISYSNK